MEKDEPKPESYYTNFGDAYKIYRDWDIARDIARIRKPKEEPNAIMEINFKVDLPCVE
jgi:hypothetical protein